MKNSARGGSPATLPTIPALCQYPPAETRRLTIIISKVGGLSRPINFLFPFAKPGYILSICIVYGPDKNLPGAENLRKNELRQGLIVLASRKP
jgi:hypothetical protein